MKWARDVAGELAATETLGNTRQRNCEMAKATLTASAQAAPADLVEHRQKNLLPPLVITPPGRPCETYLLHGTEANRQQFTSAMFIEELTRDLQRAAEQLRDVSIALAPGQDAEELRHLYDVMGALLSGRARAAAFLVPHNRSRAPFNYPAMPSAGGAKFLIFEDTMHETRHSGFEGISENIVWLRYPGQSQEALDGLVELVRESHEKWAQENVQMREHDTRPERGLVPDPRAPEPAPLTV